MSPCASVESASPGKGKKKGPETIRALLSGGSGGNRTRVRMPFHKQFYMRSGLFSFNGWAMNPLTAGPAIRLGFRFPPSGPAGSDSLFMTPLPVFWPHPVKNGCGAGRD